MKNINFPVHDLLRAISRFYYNDLLRSFLFHGHVLVFIGSIRIRPYSYQDIIKEIVSATRAQCVIYKNMFHLIIYDKTTF